MMQGKIILALSFAFIFAFKIYGQKDKPTINFIDKEFNFGTIKETDGIVIHEFSFTNKGNVPLVLNEVKSSCGCAVPEWSKEPILPGKNGIIKVSFDPNKQSGSIYKTVQINSNADIPVTLIAIKGVVIPIDRVEDVYKFKISDLRLKTIYASFGEIYKGKNATYTIGIYNTSANNPVSVSVKNIPPHLKVNITPKILEPQMEGKIEIVFSTNNIDTWDYVVDRLDILLNGTAVANNRINVTANIKEDFSLLSSEQLANSPRAVFDKYEFNFGKIPETIVVEHSFKLTNTGKTNLLIHKVSASCGCTAVQPQRTLIPPGDSAFIKAVFNPKGRSGNQKKAITVITNDPKKSKSILWINAEVN